MSDFRYLNPEKKILTPFIPVQSAMKAQGRTLSLTPAESHKVEEFMRKYPGPITLHFDAKTGRLTEMERAKV